MIQIHAPMRNPIRGIAQKNGVGISLTGMLRARKDLVSKQIKHILHLRSFIILPLFFLIQNWCMWIHIFKYLVPT